MTWVDLARMAGSLIAILALYGLARWLGLGGDRRIADDAEAAALAADAIAGFRAIAVGRDKAGIGALLRDADGRQLLLRRHGAHFVGRLLTRGIEARLDRHFLTIGTNDRQFGTLTLNLGEEAQYWASGLRHLPDA